MPTHTRGQVQSQIDRLLAQRASQWLEILGSADESERQAFVDWLRESKRHIREFLEVVAVDKALGGLDPQRLEDVEALIAQIRPEVAGLHCSKTSRYESGGESSFRNAWFQRTGLAALTATFLLAVTAAGIWLAKPGSAYSTRIGEQRTIELTDMSVVLLNTDSSIRVEMRKNARTVRLIQGEATFKVAQDKMRPFVVQARTGKIQALGTQFNVYDLPLGTRVSVLEGKVKVTPAGSKQSQLLGTGDEGVMANSGRVERAIDGDVSKAVAWQQRRLIFDNASLEDVVREFNRYNRSVRIELKDVPADSHHYDGIFDADDPASLMELLRHERDLVVASSGNKIVVRGRQSR